jgi:hypothetical protein
MASNECIQAVVAKLTTNGAITLWSSIQHPRDDDQCGRMFTGAGKWTTLASIGVENHLRKLKLIEDREVKDDYRTRTYRVWSPLGREVAKYLFDHWEDLTGTFRDGRRDV